ncbi:MAG: OB-fold domain-containing protein [Halioglobus sp.]
MTSASQLAIADGLFTWPSSSPRLLGSRCQDCQCVEFPVKTSCLACGGASVVIEELPTRGTLWTWTVQRFMPKSPYNSGETAETFRPYGVGYVELPGAVRVEGRLTENDPDKLKIGMEMELVFDVWNQDEAGNDIVSFAFRPVEASL